MRQETRVLERRNVGHVGRQQLDRPSLARPSTPDEQCGCTARINRRLSRHRIIKVRNVCAPKRAGVWQKRSQSGQPPAAEKGSRPQGISQMGSVKACRDVDFGGVRQGGRPPAGTVRFPPVQRDVERKVRPQGYLPMHAWYSPCMLR